jgi:hypothetical protein
MKFQQVMVVLAWVNAAALAWAVVLGWAEDTLAATGLTGAFVLLALFATSAMAAASTEERETGGESEQ